MVNPAVSVPKNELSEFCQRNGIRKLSFFGSVLRPDFSPTSDIDVLVEFEPWERVGLRFFAMEMELANLFGRKVDLNTPGFLSPTFREDVRNSAEVQYEASK